MVSGADSAHRYGTKALSDWFQHRRISEREREARDAIRRDQLFERRATFQRQTLLSLQEAIIQLARATGAAHHADTVAHNQTGKWGKSLLAHDLDESLRIGQTTTAMYGVRARDQSVRDMVNEFKTASAAATLANSKDSSERAMSEMTKPLASWAPRNSASSSFYALVGYEALASSAAFGRSPKTSK